MSATLQSKSGESRFVIELGLPAEYAHDPGFESSISFRGEHWDGDHTSPLSTLIEGLWLRTGDLVALLDHIAQWVSQPLDQLMANGLNGAFELARLPGQSVRVRFGSRDDTTSDLDPVITVSFSAGALQGEFYFTTDQSCLALFVEELSAELVRSQENVI
jgi:hypothetical protein